MTCRRSTSSSHGAVAYCRDSAGAHLRDVRILRADAAASKRASGAGPQATACRAAATCALMRGDVFEKVGVNVSHVWGAFEPKFRGQIPGADESEGQFVACGISLVAHLFNPYVPTVHMNLRYLRTSRAWFGGGSDLTPTFPFDEDTAQFHAALRARLRGLSAGRVSRIQGMVRPLFLSAAPAGAARRRRHLLR